jgi:hypothetical protein
MALIKMQSFAWKCLRSFLSNGIYFKVQQQIDLQKSMDGVLQSMEVQGSKYDRQTRRV